MRRAAIALVSALLPLLAASTAAQGVDLHTVRVAPRGDVVVVYSKTFNTCAHLLTPARQLTHAANIFCTVGTQIGSVHPRSAFNNLFAVGSPVQLCHGNNYNQCSPQVTITAGPTLSAPTSRLSLQAGGTQSFAVDAGSAFAGRIYLLLGSSSGTTSFQFGGHTIPLTPDGYFSFTFGSPNTFPLAASFGALDGSGQASASLTLPPGLSSALIGLTLHHAFVVLGPRTVLDVSNPWPLTLEA